MAFNQTVPVSATGKQHQHNFSDHHRQNQHGFRFGSSSPSPPAVSVSGAGYPDGRFSESGSLSGIDSDWILFSPSLNESSSQISGGHRFQADQFTDVLSGTGYDDTGTETSNGLRTENNRHDQRNEDLDLLVDNLSSIHLLPKRSLLSESGGPHGFVSLGDTAMFAGSGSVEVGEYGASLQKNDYITLRIDSWRKEQARALIKELHPKASFSAGSGSGPAASTPALSAAHYELLASWGVDDCRLGDAQAESERNFRGDVLQKLRNRPTKQHQQRQQRHFYQYHNKARFYGDDIFKNFTEWEVTKIKQVAHHLRSSLVRDSGSPSGLGFTHERRQLSNCGRRSSFLLKLTQAKDPYLIDASQGISFWRRDLGSAHSSLSVSTSSIMFGNGNGFHGDVL